MRDFATGLPNAGDAEFRLWLVEHPDDYFINIMGETSGMLHRGRCPHMIYGPDDISNLVTRSKWTSEHRRELEARAQREDRELRYCQHCDLSDSAIRQEGRTPKQVPRREMQSEKADILVRVCTLLSAGDRDDAASLARAEYPFEGRAAVHRKFSRVQAMGLFIRDGFIDRYSGKRLVFPGTLLLLSRLLPVEFPTHPNWKMSATHFAYWELWPTIDHQVPVTREGRDELSNWVCTSMMKNAAKSHWSLSELAWSLLPPGDFRVWDGLTAWCLEFLSREPIHLEDRALAGWHSAAVSAMRA